MRAATTVTMDRMQQEDQVSDHELVDLTESVAQNRNSMTLSMSDELNGKLCRVKKDLSNYLKHLLLTRIWSEHLDTGDLGLKRYDAFFKNYVQVCEDLPNELGDKTHADLIEVIDRLKSSLTKEEMNVDEGLLEVAASVWLMLDLSYWEPTQTLREYVEETFIESSQNDEINLPKTFNIYKVFRITEIDIHWTSDLSQHLAVSNLNSTVAFFHHATILLLHKESNTDILPVAVVDEALRTMALLLPSEKRVKRWYKREASNEDLDRRAVGQYLALADRRLQSFKFWRDRLISLKALYDGHKPHRILQFFRDDRDQFLYWQLWIGVLASLYALISIIEGALQVYKAYHPSPSP
jgi:hypothetical protein